MNKSTLAPIIIIGNGIAGTTLARHFRKKSDHPLLLISDESDYFFSRTAMMYVFMGHLRWEDTKPYEDPFWIKNNIQCLRGRVIELEATKKTIVLENGKRLCYEELVFATGSVPKRMNWPGEESKGVFSLYHKKDMDQLDQWVQPNQKAVVVGGGLIGVELAEMFRSRNLSVTYLVRESHFWKNALCVEEANIITSHLKAHGIEMLFNTEVQGILSGPSGEVTHVQTQAQKKIECQTVGITIGVRPQVDFLRTSALNIDQGIIVDNMLKTNLPHIYAIGDCAQLAMPLPHRKAIEPVWYSGRMMGETLAQTLTGNPTPYRPGHWFNSAKFFDIEYQTYGQMTDPLIGEENQFIWQDKKNNKSLRFAFSKKNNQFLGISSLGLRLRHETFDRWLNQKVKIETVINNLEEAHFDAEFSHRYENEIKKKWNNNCIF